MLQELDEREERLCSELAVVLDASTWDLRASNTMEGVLAQIGPSCLTLNPGVFAHAKSTTLELGTQSIYAAQHIVATSENNGDVRVPRGLTVIPTSDAANLGPEETGFTSFAGRAVREARCWPTRCVLGGPRTQSGEGPACSRVV